MADMTNFCRSTVQVYRNTLDISDCSEISGLGVSSNGLFLYAINDSPGAHARIFAFNKTNPGKPVIIEITGIRETGFNPSKGRGYGDWEALAVGTHPQDPSKRCIIVADVGHNKARDPKGGAFRRDDQQTRLIYVEEPSKAELSSGAMSIVKPGYEFPIMYTSNNLKYDAEAIAVQGDIVMVITKNKREGDKRSFVFTCPNASLVQNRISPMSLLGETTIEFSHVTDAFATPHFLVLRTYIGVNFYALGDFTPGVSATMRGCQRLDELKERGQQEAIAFDAKRQTIFMIGEGSSELFSLKFNAEHAWVQMGGVRGPVLSRKNSPLTPPRRAPSQLPQQSSTPPRRAPSQLPLSRARTDGLELWRSDFDTARAVAKMSGSCFSTSGQYIYAINEATDVPLLYAFHQDTLRMTIIDMQGLNPSSYKAKRGVGFGDWTSLDMCCHPTDPNKKCIVIADVGNAKASEQGPVRRANQPMRLLFVEEPTAEELSAGPSVVKLCSEYAIKYSEKNLQYDSHSMAIIENMIFLICRNRDGDKKNYIFTCAADFLKPQRVSALELLCEIAVPSDANEAFITPRHLVLRTSLGIHLYALGDLALGQEVPVKESIHLDELKDIGKQQTMAYNAETQKITFFGQGRSAVYTYRLKNETRISPRLPTASTHRMQKPIRGKMRRLDRPGIHSRKRLPPATPVMA